jgi:hypothetical protein
VILSGMGVGHLGQGVLRQALIERWARVHTLREVDL